MVIRIVIFLFMLLCPAFSYSATINSTDCTKAAIDTAISSASTGDTISVNGGAACTATWTGTVTIPDDKKLTIQGAGKTSTVITHGSNWGFSMGSSGSRITAIGFIATGSGYSIDVKGSGWRIDHCKFTNSTGSSHQSINPSGANVTYLPVGVIDNNEFIESRIVLGGMGTFAKMNIEWATDSVIGTGNTVYIEDNTFYKTVDGGGNVIDANYAGAFVARYNTITGTTSIMAHSVQGCSERSTRSWEVYGNSITTSSAVITALFMRGGTGMIFGNNLINYTSEDISFDNVRINTNYGSPCYACNGSSPWDGNDDAIGWPCRDQIGRGKDASLWTDLNPYPDQTSEPAYIWFNRDSSASITPVIGNGCDNWILPNRDYYAQGASFDGTTGVGCGTLASRPATCTTGVGYWATNQSCSDLTGLVGASPTTPISGTLYKCTSTNTWTSFYTPYAYPHPLRTEAFAGGTGFTLSGGSVQ